MTSFIQLTYWTGIGSSRPYCSSILAFCSGGQPCPPPVQMIVATSPGTTRSKKNVSAEIVSAMIGMNVSLRTTKRHT